MLKFMMIGGYNMWILMGIGAVMVVTAIRFARAADAQRLSMLRTLTFAILTAAVTGFFSGLIKTCLSIEHGDPAQMAERLPQVVIGFGESCANLVLGGSFVVVTWLLIAVGVRRMPDDPMRL
ncbi:MAG TPA: hypothetical protein VGC42_22275 [Kofleriaceae bacterium]